MSLPTILHTLARDKTLSIRISYPSTRLNTSTHFAILPIIATTLTRNWYVLSEKRLGFSLTVPQCWLGDDTLSLPDVNTENDFVKATWDQWAKDVVANYSGWLPSKVGTGTADRNS